MKTLILTVGLPRSGKTTWAKEQGLPIVNRDAIRLSLHGHRFLREAEDMITVLETLMVKSLFRAGHEKVIVDATHNTEKRRERWKSEDWELQYHYVKTPAEECLRRARQEGDTVIIPIIEKMASEADW